jgi:hypothetical protein
MAEVRRPEGRRMLSPQFVILGAALNALGHVDYVVDTLRGRCRPSIVTWTLWSVPPGIALAAEIVADAGPQALLTFALAIGPVSVLCACAVSHTACWAMTRVDWWCGALSCATILLWMATSNARLAIGLAIMTDALAAVPTVVKAYRVPSSESTGAFGLFVAGAGVTLLTIDDWNLATCGFPVYIFGLSVLILGLLVVPRRQLVAVPTG